MKRASSSTKENGSRYNTHKLSTRKKPQEHHLSSLSSTQTFFANNFNTQINTLNPPNNPLYRTSGNYFVQWSRPQSKHAYRHNFIRPQTSKGRRPPERITNKWQHQSKGAPFHSHYLPDKSQDQYREQQSGEIEIVINKVRMQKDQRSKVARSKFQTDLDDQFLQLFAN